MKTIQTQLPDNLYDEAIFLVKKGWFRDEQESLFEALDAILIRIILTRRELTCLD